jgi:hypothetical protein
MGWDEYFVRKGHPVYVPDQVGRGRSGFNQAVFNDVRVGVTRPSALPPMWRTSGNVPTGIPNFSWQAAYEGCRAFVTRVNAAGGSARMLHLSDLGIRGNSHMMMQDRNNLQVADLILKWIDESVGTRKAQSLGRPGKSIRR